MASKSHASTKTVPITPTLGPRLGFGTPIQCLTHKYWQAVCNLAKMSKL
jgi:hypothetical protein